MTIETTIGLGTNGAAFVITTTGAASFAEASSALVLTSVETMGSVVGWTLNSTWDAGTSTATGFIFLSTPLPPEALAVIAEAMGEALNTEFAHDILPAYVDGSALVVSSSVVGPIRIRNVASLSARIVSPSTFDATAILAPILSPADHATLRDLIHFLDDGPGPGFPSICYRESLPALSPFPTSETWWTSAAKTTKILELLITRDAGKKPTLEVWNLFDSGGSLLATVTDSISYSGAFETSRTRVFS